MLRHRRRRQKTKALKINQFLTCQVWEPDLHRLKKRGKEVGLLGLLKLKRKEASSGTATASRAASGTAPAPMPEEPDFLKELEVSVEKEVERDIDNPNASPADTAKQETEPELELWLNNGMTVRSLRELARALGKMKVSDYKEHANEERNDIADWVGEVLNNPDLAKSLRGAKSKAQAARQVEKEIARLSKSPKRKQGDFGASKRRTQQRLSLPKGITQIIPQAAEALESETKEKTQRKGILGLFWKKSKPELEEPEKQPEVELPELKTTPMPETEGPKEDIMPAESEPHHEAWSEASVLEEPSAPSTAQAAEKTAAEKDYELPLPAITEEKTLPTEDMHPVKKATGERKTHEEAELDRKEHELMAAEEALNKEEEGLNARRLMLTKKRYDLIKQKGEVERKRFEAFMRKHKQATEEYSHAQAQAESDKSLKGMPDFSLRGAYGKERLQALLEEAKQHISQNNIEQARKALLEAQSAFTTAYLPDSEKKQVEYEILEVEADLKLATLR